MSNRRALLRGCSVLVLAWAMAWGGFPPAAPAENPAGLAGTLEVPGTGDSQAMLRAMIPLFRARHPGAALVVPDSVGSSGGIRAVLDGKAALGRVARALNDKERSAGLERRVFAWSPVVIAANLPAGTRMSLTYGQIVGVYDGSISDYAQLGGPPGKIYPLMRERGDSSLSTIKGATPGFADIREPVGKAYYTTPEAIQSLVAHPGALGYAPLAAVKGTVLTVLAVEGVEPTPDNVRSGAYPLAASLGLVHRENPGPLAVAFMDFLESPEAVRVMERFGCIPATNPLP